VAPLKARFNRKRLTPAKLQPALTHTDLGMTVNHRSTVPARSAERAAVFRHGISQQ